MSQLKIQSCDLGCVFISKANCGNLRRFHPISFLRRYSSSVVTAILKLLKVWSAILQFNVLSLLSHYQLITFCRSGRNHRVFFTSLRICDEVGGEDLFWGQTVDIFSLRGHVLLAHVQRVEEVHQEDHQHRKQVEAPQPRLVSKLSSGFLDQFRKL